MGIYVKYTHGKKSVYRRENILIFEINPYFDPEPLELSDLLVVVDGVKTVPNPEKVLEVQGLYYEGAIAKHEAKHYLSAGFN